jgi:hypothetical protein
MNVWLIVSDFKLERFRKTGRLGLALNVTEISTSCNVARNTIVCLSARLYSPTIHEHSQLIRQHVNCVAEAVLLHSV